MLTLKGKLNCWGSQGDGSWTRPTCSLPVGRASPDGKEEEEEEVGRASLEKWASMEGEGDEVERGSGP